MNMHSVTNSLLILAKIKNASAKAEERIRDKSGK